MLVHGESCSCFMRWMCWLHKITGAAMSVRSFQLSQRILKLQQVVAASKLVLFLLELTGQDAVAVLQQQIRNREMRWSWKY